MTPTKSSVNPNRTSAGSIARTRISAWIVVKAVAIASSANAADVDSRGWLAVFSCPGRNKYTRLPPYAPIRISAVQKLRRSIAAGCAASVPYTERSNTAGMTSATTARNSIAAVFVAAVR